MTGITHSGLKDISLFRGLSDADLAWIVGQLYCKTFAPGSNIITAEQPGEVVYILLRGTVKIHIEQADGRDVILAILGPGDIVGEMSLLDSAGRSASVVTLEDTTLMWMGRATFYECMNRIPAFNQNLVRILSSRVRLANELIQALSSLDVNGRVARQILAFAEKHGLPGKDGSVLIPIRLTQSEVADLVGASRKRVNQVMVSFKQQGLIGVDNDGRITILDRAGLARLCR